MYIASFTNTEVVEDRETKRLINVLFGRRQSVDCDLSVAVERAEPGGSFPAHSHDLEQMFYVVQGKMQVRVDDETEVLETGAIVYVPRGSIHEGWNIGDGPLVYLVIDHWPSDSEDRLGLD